MHWYQSKQSSLIHPLCFIPNSFSFLWFYGFSLCSPLFRFVDLFSVLTLLCCYHCCCYCCCSCCCCLPACLPKSHTSAHTLKREKAVAHTTTVPVCSCLNRDCIVHSIRNLISCTLSLESNGTHCAHPATWN